MKCALERARSIERGFCKSISIDQRELAVPTLGVPTPVFIRFGRSSLDSVVKLSSLTSLSSVKLIGVDSRLNACELVRSGSTRSVGLEEKTTAASQAIN